MKIKRVFKYCRTILQLGFRNVGFLSVISNPLKIVNPRSIYLGKKVYIHDYAWLYCSDNNKHRIIVDDGSVIGHFSHIVAKKKVTIGKCVLIADKVFISDCTHEYKNISIPIINQDVNVIKPVDIGDDSWLGENVCVCGASIGNHCVIGANSVVTKDIPDYCIAVGTPARVVKRYDFNEEKWIEVN